MKREIVHIDEEKCDGCGLCIPNCHEGALQLIDGKARLISDLMCDGLGACLGHCPQDAITIEKREAEPYDEVKVMKIMVDKGANTVKAHLEHLKDHMEFGYLKQGVGYLKAHAEELPFDVNKIIAEVHSKSNGCSTGNNEHKHEHKHGGGGCPGSASRSFAPKETAAATAEEVPSQLTHWPVQMHLIHPGASHFQNADVLLSASCVAYALGSFHSSYLKGKAVGIACPKLDSNQQVYLDKLIALIDEARINTLTVMIMEVPCCGGLLQMAKMATQQAKRKIPVKAVVVGVDGNIRSEEWV
jgi:NAD-dependent dihydropyrimidine dehydrogenase PreA subunit